jgi:hypothetical protein
MSSLAPSSGIAFGFRWSLVGCFTALLYIASCDLFIPPDRSVPRYNSVHGAPKRPMLNPGGSAYQAPTNTQSRREQAIDDAYGSGNPAIGTSAVPVAPLPQNNEAAQSGSAPNLSAARRAQKEEEESSGFWSSLAFWESDEEAPAPRKQPQPEDVTSGVGAAAPTAPVVAADLAPPAIGANGYPILSNTPPVPSSDAINNSRQNAIASQGELESGRQGAIQMQGQVAADAAAEPSLLSTYPQGARPAQPAPQSGPGPQSRAVPLENPSPAMLGDAGSIPAQPVVVRGTVASTANAGGAIEPIRLTPPGSVPDAGVAGNVGGAPTPGVITLSAPPTRYSGTNGYLPESRYSQRNPARLTGPYATVQ